MFGGEAAQLRDGVAVVAQPDAQVEQVLQGGEPALGELVQLDPPQWTRGQVGERLAAPQ
jgi:hypothetical protein